MSEKAARLTNHGEFCPGLARRPGAQIARAPPAWHIRAMLRIDSATTAPRALRTRAAALVGMALAATALAVTQAPAQPATPERELLNSERIEQRFGSYGIDVLAQSDTVRVSSLFSRHEGRRVTRTFAVVLYPGDVDARLAGAHETILDGGSIGAVFTARGWSVGKRHRFFGLLDSTVRVERMMGGIAPTPLAVHVYVLDVARSGTRLEYATIVEVHHPDYLALDELQAIYGNGYAPPVRLDELARLVETLELTRARMRDPGP